VLLEELAQLEQQRKKNETQLQEVSDAIANERDYAKVSSMSEDGETSWLLFCANPQYCGRVWH
jgi:hypothetical protein